MQTTGKLNESTTEYENLYRLPDTVKPVKYQLTLDPNIEEGTFKGDAIITVKLERSCQRIFLNSHLLTITAARVFDSDDGKPRNNESPPIINYNIEGIYMQTKRQLLIICMETALAKGQYLILLSYTGKLNNESVGLYRTWTNTPGELPSYSLATYFEPTYARYAFPCFDEPHLKAKYSVSLIKPSGDEFVALSNSSVKLETMDFPRQGVTTVTFNETEPISSYLTCFIIGPYKCLDPATALSGRLPISVYSQPDLVAQTAFSRDLAAKIIDYFSQYFQIEYPFPKLDLIALPDSKLNGMENWGLITFRETALLYSPEEGSTNDLLSVVKVVVHELSHMWFGNLVTISWWDDTWLKEGMANFMAFIGGHYAFPTWFNEWVFLSGQVIPALQKDSSLSSRPVILPVSNQDQIREMFDAISYRKGSCLIRMLHDLNSEKFRRSLMNYVNNMKWSNATTSDLWEAMSKCMELPIGDIMGTWTEQMGYPLLTVSKRDHDFEIKQTRFLTDATSSYDPSSSPYRYVWDVPIKYFTSKDKEKVETLWFYRDSESVYIDAPPGVKWVKLNWHYVGFYRVNYSHQIWFKFADLLVQDDKAFDAEDRCCLINDAFCLANAGYINYDIPMNLIMYVQNGKENNFLVWSVIKAHIEKMQSLLASNKVLSMFNRYIQELINPFVTQLNWETSENVPYMERKLRAELIDLSCLLNYENVLIKIRSFFTDLIDKKKNIVDPEIRSIVHTYGLSGPIGVDLWEKTWQCFLFEQNPWEIVNLLRSLASTNNPDLITRLLSEAKNPDVIRSQYFFDLLKYISKTPIGNSMVWAFIRNEWPYLVARYTLNDLNLGFLVSYVISNFNTPEMLAEVEDFFEKYPESGAGASERKHAIESIKANIRWTEANSDFLENWFLKLL